MLKFTPEVKFGDILLVVTLVGSVAIPTINGYFGVQAAIEKVRTDTQAKVTEHELRISALEHSREEDRKDARDFQTDVKGLVAKMSDVLQGLEVQLARVAPPGPRKGVP